MSEDKIEKLGITFAEVMAEIEKYEKRKDNGTIKISPEQKQFLIRCREKGIFYTDMCILWEKLWGKTSPTNLKRRVSIIERELGHRLANGRPPYYRPNIS